MVPVGEMAHTPGMLWTSVVLLLAAALLHATSHALIKNGKDQLAFAWWMLGVSSVAGIPLLFSLREVPLAGWLLVIASGLAEAAYFAALTRGYARGDLSQVYPLARGSAPLFTLLWATLFLGERPSPGGLGGIALVAAGLYLVALRSLGEWKRPVEALKQTAARWAIATGIFISTYTTIDKVGVRFFPPITYLYLVLAVGWVALSPQWLSARRRGALVAEIRAAPLRTIGCSLLGFGAYTLVLVAMRSSPVSYVASVREISVVLGAWIGLRFLGEEGGAHRIAGAALVAAGIAAIALLG